MSQMEYVVQSSGDCTKFIAPPRLVIVIAKMANRGIKVRLACTITFGFGNGRWNKILGSKSRLVVLPKQQF